MFLLYLTIGFCKIFFPSATTTFHGKHHEGSHYNALIVACGQDADGAKAVFEQLKADGFEPGGSQMATPVRPELNRSF